ncbi:hypothetical protein B0H10DRAFT_1947138 [Mycena sp. CBHHK59/15]|nr:hypothetical protein B0H10DRAFT_1947138 [Mycena sp. CBHHK59/15]
MPVGSTPQRPHKRSPASFLRSPIIPNYQSSMPGGGSSILHALIAPVQRQAWVQTRFPPSSALPMTDPCEIYPHPPMEVRACSTPIKRQLWPPSHMAVNSDMNSILSSRQEQRRLSPQRLPFSDTTWESPSPPSLARSHTGRMSASTPSSAVPDTYLTHSRLANAFCAPRNLFEVLHSQHEPPPPRARMASLTELTEH